MSPGPCTAAECQPYIYSAVFTATLSLHFTNNLGQQLLNRFILKPPYCIFHEPNLFSYPALSCCCKDASLTLCGDGNYKRLPFYCTFLLFASFLLSSYLWAGSSHTVSTALIRLSIINPSLRDRSHEGNGKHKEDDSDASLRVC